ADPLGYPGRAIADRDHGHAGAEVDERVAVRVHQHAAAGGGDEHGQDVADAAGDRALAPREQLAGRGPGNLGDEAALLRERGAAGDWRGHERRTDENAPAPGPPCPEPPGPASPSG